MFLSTRIAGSPVSLDARTSCRSTANSFSTVGFPCAVGYSQGQSSENSEHSKKRQSIVGTVIVPRALISFPQICVTNSVDYLTVPLQRGIPIVCFLNPKTTTCRLEGSALQRMGHKEGLRPEA